MSEGIGSRWPITAIVLGVVCCGCGHAGVESIGDDDQPLGGVRASLRTNRSHGPEGGKASSGGQCSKQAWRKWNADGLVSASGSTSVEPWADAGATAANEVGGDAGASLPDEVAAEPETSSPSEAAVADGGVDTTDPPAAGELPEPPPALPADIVELSRLPYHGVVNGEPVSRFEVDERLKWSAATCLGELHDNPYHHNLQLRVMQDLASVWGRSEPSRRKRGDDRPQEPRAELAIGYEMIQRPFQAPLSEYMRGNIAEDAFIEQTEYAERWGYDLALYRPLFEENREAGLPALALNAPRELTRQIGREGLESLTPELAELLPELDLQDAEHRSYIFSLFGITPDHPAAASLENIYIAQVTWDETMAQTSSEWLNEREGRRLLVLAGVAHCHRSAIPRRVSRRTGGDMLSVAAVLESELSAFPDDWGGYDLLVVLEDEAAP